MGLSEERTGATLPMGRDPLARSLLGDSSMAQLQKEAQPVASGIRRSAQIVRAAHLSLRASKSGADEETTRRARAALAEQLGSLRGLPMKLGQLLTMGDDGDPLSELVHGATPMSQAETEAILTSELGREWRQEIIELGPAHHAASIGQVHLARRASDGCQLAVKVQYPKIAEGVATELSLLGVLPRLGPLAKYRFDLASYKNRLRENFERELDYEREAHLQLAFAEATAVPGLIVPRPIFRLTTKKVLVQVAECGARLHEARHFSKPTRLRIASTLLRTFFRSVFEVGLIHGDPHPGNYAFRENGEVILYDFGCTVELAQSRRLALLGIILALREGRPEIVTDLWVELGFDKNKLAHVSDKMLRLSELVFAPFLSEGVWNISGWQLRAKLKTLLGDLSWWFRAAGPSDLFLLMRSFQGLLEMQRLLQVDLPWWPLLQSTLNEQTVAAARDICPVRHFSPAKNVTAPLASLLRVRVESGAEPIVMTYPAAEARALSQLVPEGLLASGLQEELKRVEARLADSGLLPGTLVEGTTQGTSYRVWLE